MTAWWEPEALRSILRQLWDMADGLDGLTRESAIRELGVDMAEVDEILWLACDKLLLIKVRSINGEDHAGYDRWIYRTWRARP